MIGNNSWKTRALLAAVILAGSTIAVAQDSSGEKRPTPRYDDGSVNLGPAEGETGHWDTGVGNLAENFVEMDGAFLVNPEDIDKVAPFRPWTKALVQFRLATLGRDDPNPKCMPNGGPRQFHTPVGIEIVEARDRKKIYVLSGGGPHSWREIHMDGREHPSLDD